jgi:hypothetical protein
VAACAEGTYKEAEISAVACTDCPQNSGTGFTTSSKAENDCKADAGFTGEGASVTACAVGKYKTVDQSSAACSDCAKGEYTDVSGSIRCKKCPSKWFLANNASMCIEKVRHAVKLISTPNFPTLRVSGKNYLLLRTEDAIEDYESWGWCKEYFEASTTVLVDDKTCSDGGARYISSDLVLCEVDT